MRVCERISRRVDGEPVQVIEPEMRVEIADRGFKWVERGGAAGADRGRLRREGGEPFDLRQRAGVTGEAVEAGRARTRAATDDASHRIGWMVGRSVQPGVEGVV